MRLNRSYLNIGPIRYDFNPCESCPGRSEEYHPSHMLDFKALLTDFRRLADAIRVRLANSDFAPTSEDAMSVQVERGMIYRDAVLGSESRGALVERLIELATSDRLSRVVVVDTSGHHRPVYRALLVYSWLQAY